MEASQPQHESQSSHSAIHIPSSGASHHEKLPSISVSRSHSLDEAAFGETSVLSTSPGRAISRPRWRVPVQFSPLPSLEPSSPCPLVAHTSDRNDIDCNLFDNEITVEYSPAADWDAHVQTNSFLTCCGERVKPPHLWRPTAAKQLQDILQLMQDNVIEDGDAVFILSNSWWKRWTNYVSSATNIQQSLPESQDSLDYDPVGPIDNWDIIDLSVRLPVSMMTSLPPTGGSGTNNPSNASTTLGPLLENMVNKQPAAAANTLPANFERSTVNNKTVYYHYQKCRYSLLKTLYSANYVVVHKEIWSALRWWYGGGPPISRIVVELNGSAHDRGVPSVTAECGINGIDVSRLNDSMCKKNYAVDLFPVEPPCVLDAINKESLFKSDGAPNGVVVLKSQSTAPLTSSSQMDVCEENFGNSDSDTDTFLVHKRTHTDMRLDKRPALLFAGVAYNDCGASRWQKADFQSRFLHINDSKATTNESTEARSTSTVNSNSDDGLYFGDVADANSCFACRKIAAYRCSRCCAVYYCSKACQEVCHTFICVFLVGPFLVNLSCSAFFIESLEISSDMV
jgi:hypothetical protein